MQGSTGDRDLLRSVLADYQPEAVIHFAANAYVGAGADPDGDLGEVHDPETHLIPRVIQAALGELPEVGIFGTDYPTPDGTAVRDYIHVTDLADAHIRAIDALGNGHDSLVLNLGTGQGHSVREVIDMVERVYGRSVPVREEPRREGDPAELVAAPEAAGALLEWKPVHSDLHAIGQTVARWQRMLSQ